jgi:hypothetical protein
MTLFLVEYGGRSELLTQADVDRLASEFLNRGWSDHVVKGFRRDFSRLELASCMLTLTWLNS